MFDRPIKSFWEVKRHVGFLKFLWLQKLIGETWKEQSFAFALFAEKRIRDQ